MGFPVLSAIPIIGDVLKGIIEIIDKSVPDKDAAAKMQQDVTMKVMEIQFALQNGQIEVNKVEAANQNLFVSGWRPAIGWTCALALFWQFVGYDMTVFGLSVMNSSIVAPKLIASDNLFELVLAMLGLAGFRSYEKTKGTV
jgi:hypothetical protein